MPEYTVSERGRVERFLKRHSQLIERYVRAKQVISNNPRGAGGRSDPQGAVSDVAHLKAKLLCSYRYRVGSFRILYDVNDERQRVDIFDIDSRENVY